MQTAPLERRPPRGLVLAHKLLAILPPDNHSSGVAEYRVSKTESVMNAFRQSAHHQSHSTSHQQAGSHHALALPIRPSYDLSLLPFTSITFF